MSVDTQTLSDGLLDIAREQANAKTLRLRPGIPLDQLLPADATVEQVVGRQLWNHIEEGRQLYQLWRAWNGGRQVYVNRPGGKREDTVP